jgi:hypothetical protein
MVLVAGAILTAGAIATVVVVSGGEDGFLGSGLKDEAATVPTAEQNVKAVPKDDCSEISGLSIKNKASGHVIDNSSSVHKDGNAIVSWPPNKQDNQKWGIEKSLAGGCLIYLDDDALVMQYVIRDNPSTGHLELAKYTSDDPSNLWKFRSTTTDGFAEIYNVKTNECIAEVESSDRDPSRSGSLVPSSSGAPSEAPADILHTEPCTGSSAQQWQWISQ